MLSITYIFQSNVGLADAHEPFVERAKFDDHHRAPGLVLLQGPEEELVLTSEVLLYGGAGLGCGVRCGMMSTIGP